MWKNNNNDSVQLWGRVPRSSPEASVVGFSLVGLLIAAFIIVMVVMASSRLFGSAQKAATISREKFIALNVAREGLELVHAMRDNNWFTNTDRSFWLDHGLCVDNADNHQIFIEPKTVRNNDTATNDGSSNLYINHDTKQWTHESANGEQTPYSRQISIDCSTKDGVPADNKPAFVTVTSTVTWQSANQDKSVVLKEQLYNWLPEQRKQH